MGIETITWSQYIPRPTNSCQDEAATSGKKWFKRRVGDQPKQGEPKPSWAPTKPLEVHTNLFGEGGSRERSEGACAGAETAAALSSGFISASKSWMLCSKFKRLLRSRKGVGKKTMSASIPTTPQTKTTSCSKFSQPSNRRRRSQPANRERPHFRLKHWRPHKMTDSKSLPRQQTFSVRDWDNQPMEAPSRKMDRLGFKCKWEPMKTFMQLYQNAGPPPPNELTGFHLASLSHKPKKGTLKEKQTLHGINVHFIAFHPTNDERCILAKSSPSLKK